jgi:hypothetical protein
MRRIWSYVLISMGLFLIFLAPLIRLYAYPRVLKAPLDTYDVSVSPGGGSYFSAKELKVVTGRRLENVSTARGDVNAGSETVSVYDYFSATKDLDAGGAVIEASRDRFVFDRLSAEPVHCCGERPRHDGLTLKFPFNVEKKTYDFWDGTLGDAAPATYASETTMEGLKVFVFKQHIDPSIAGTLEVGGELAGVPEMDKVIAFISYTADTTLWVEPLTGAIIKGSQHAVRKLQYGGKEILLLADVNFTNGKASVQRTADRVRTKYFQLNLVRLWLPAFGPILGLILVVAGLLLRGRIRPDRRIEQPMVLSRPAAQP